MIMIHWDSLWTEITWLLTPPGTAGRWWWTCLSSRFFWPIWCTWAHVWDGHLCHEWHVHFTRWHGAAAGDEWGQSHPCMDRSENPAWLQNALRCILFQCTDEKLLMAEFWAQVSKFCSVSCWTKGLKPKRQGCQGINRKLVCVWGFLGGAVVKNSPAVAETWVRSLGQKDSPGEGNGKWLQSSCLEKVCFVFWTDF